MEELTMCFEKFVEHFKNEEILSSLRKQIAEETTEDAFEQLEEEPSEKDVLELYDNLHLVEVGVFSDCYVLHFRTPDMKPDDLDICVQLESSFEFECYTQSLHSQNRKNEFGTMNNKLKMAAPNN